MHASLSTALERTGGSCNRDGSIYAPIFRTVDHTTFVGVAVETGSARWHGPNSENAVRGFSPLTSRLSISIHPESETLPNSRAPTNVFL